MHNAGTVSTIRRSIELQSYEINNKKSKNGVKNSCSGFFRPFIRPRADVIL